MIKAVIFDYGGVMKNYAIMGMDIATVFNIPLEEVQKAKPLTLPFITLLVSGLISEKDCWREISAIFKKPFPSDYKKLSRDIYEKNLVLNLEMFAFAEELKKKKFKVAILSNITKYSADIIRKHKGYKGFKHVILSYKEKLRKPDPAFYLLAIKKLKVKPEECIFIDDAEKNLVPAEKLGMKTVLFKNPKQAIKDILDIIKE